MTTQPDIDVVTSILHRHLPSGEWRAYLFGSRARGDALAGSDWDIGLLGPAPVSGAVVQRIRAELEDLPTLHTFDVVDLGAAPADFRDAALRGSVRLL